jgi:hypothetical protein
VLTSLHGIFPEFTPFSFLSKIVKSSNSYNLQEGGETVGRNSPGMGWAVVEIDVRSAKTWPRQLRKTECGKVSRSCFINCGKWRTCKQVCGVKNKKKMKK